jgi:hypothetical protein
MTDEAEPSADPKCPNTGTERVLLEKKVPDDTWVRVGSVTPADRPGSISDETPGRPRDVYVFGWRDGEQGPCLWKSIGGVDEAFLGTNLVIVSSVGYQLMADLREVTPVLNIHRPRLGGTTTVRFRYQR